MYVLTMQGPSQARGLWGFSPPVFGRSIHPISIRVGTLSPPITTSPPEFSDFATALHKHFNRRSQLLLKSEFRSHLNEFERTPSPIPRVLYTTKSDWNSWNFYMFNKHLSFNQILCFFVVILTTINCCRNQPYKRLDLEPTWKRIKMIS